MGPRSWRQVVSFQGGQSRQKLQSFVRARVVKTDLGLGTDFLLSVHVVHKSRQNKGLNGFLDDLNRLKLPYVSKYSKW